ncbi:MAG: non-homologous end-joining DNA ligase [Candidatus Zixiibacteriota bacterium]
MLAKLTDERFSKDNWIFERKLDGERCLAVSKNGRVRLYSRNKKKLNDTYPEIADALEEQDTTGYIVDGEIVAFEGNRTSFARLQNRMQIKDRQEARESRTAVYYYVFDVLYADRHDVTNVPLSDRKTILKNLLNYNDPLRLTPYRKRAGEKYFREACRKGWEGVIAKRFDAPYSHNRSGDWLKFKCVNEQELVIGGFTEPQGSRIGFGALLVGYYKNRKLRYAGKVGTGYDDNTLRRLKKKLSDLERKTNPFAGEDIQEKRVHWVTPDLVAQVGFTEWTEDGKLRHPRFLGLRNDKDPSKVVREKASN